MCLYLQDTTRHYQDQEEGTEFSGLPNKPYDWGYSINGKVTGELPEDISNSIQKYVAIIDYVDASTYSGFRIGISATHPINKIPLDWNYKKQSTIERAIY